MYCGSGGAAPSCTPDHLTFLLPSGISCPSLCQNGTVWAPDYWPVLLPFTVQRGASSVEVWECSLDYAYGVQTTTWVNVSTGGSGCAEWGVNFGTGDTTYQNALSQTVAGQPAFTSTFVGSWLFQGSQF